MNATTLLSQLKEEKLRERLEEIQAEEKALRVLLRSAAARRRARQRTAPKGGAE